jgi:pyruvate dehydrogenase E2 component (dihydrolipoamide acetyltransferase)
MATAIRMPDLGTNVEEVKLTEWLKQEGEQVRRGDSLCEVETDKATEPLESVAEGVLLRQMVPAGSDVQSGTIIAYIGEPGEAVPGQEAEAPAAATPESQTPQSQTSGRGVKVSPVIRNLAKREGVDLDTIVGTGVGGQITREDVLAAKKPAAAAEQAAPLPRDQAAVARRVSRSNQEIPTISLTASLDMSAAIRLRKRLLRKSSQKISYDAIFLHAAAQAIRQFPSFAGHCDGERAIAHGSIDVCLAISHQRRLYTPVVRGADCLSLVEIEAAVRGLVEKARAGELTAADLNGGSFTVSNLGMFPVESFNVIIPPEQAGALAIGTIVKRPVFRERRFEAAPLATVVVSIDHRLINGAEGAEFLQQVKQIVESL